MTAVFRPIVLVPVFDHEHAIGAMVEAILRHPWPCLLVDDGSGPACSQVLRDLADAHGERVILIRLPQNRGKGAAMMAGFQEAAKLGYTHALQIDADGQHNADDIACFFTLARENPTAVIAGCPVYDQTVPRHRFYFRYLTHILVWINTLSFEIRDSMCGLRVYPLDAVTALMQDVRLGHHMEFDTEVIVRLYWRGVSVVNVPTRVTYPSDGVSHFRLIQDNLLMTGMLTRLFFGMLWRMPRLLWRKVRPA
ncbi:glycosyltransferase family 2 protein [Cupriavidus metallidurans]|uniref:glycosyltransferase family 2 protein n=1 Tax=Cupriavidus TaxID=106589 RepID=UPI0002A44EB0|nr:MULTISPECIES: glycosyltransferase family 2 protein [Cupriavidus]EKZ98352.1 family 2 glycosyl transferase [Cupriavidus sp. HMR-1]HBD36608.1 glycosyltransferase family 2 protein [Cupriavidus sp.]HBO78095.1 glycosyltransferase family 2 protein [Cupriavidus sp.]